MPRIARAAALFVAVVVPAQGGPARVVTPASAPAAGSPPDPCVLLSDEDVRALHGQPVSQRVPSARPTRRFRVSQCVYRTPDLTHSVSVALTAPLSPAAAGSVRAYWKDTFSPVPGKTDPPRPVSGIGDEAYWVGDRVAGALYVLSGDVFVRISVGGIPEEAPRLERTMALGRRILERLADR